MSKDRFRDLNNYLITPYNSHIHRIPSLECVNGELKVVWKYISAREKLLRDIDSKTFSFWMCVFWLIVMLILVLAL